MEAMIKGDPNQPFNEDLPGGGQFYDMFTGRHFESKEALERHMKPSSTSATRSAC